MEYANRENSSKGDASRNDGDGMVDFKDLAHRLALTSPSLLKDAELMAIAEGGLSGTLPPIVDESPIESPSNADVRPNDSSRAAVLAAIEYGRRLAESQLFPEAQPTKLSSTAAAKAYCRKAFLRLSIEAKQEEMHVITLDTKNQVISQHLVTVGTLDASLVHPREIFRPAILDAASSIMLVHNHPSGDPTPSREDLTVTKRIEDAGRILGIDVLDHIVVAKNGLVSIREVN